MINSKNQIFTTQKLKFWQLNFWQNLKQSYGKNNLTPWQLMRCSRCSILQSCDIFLNNQPNAKIKLNKLSNCHITTQVIVWSGLVWSGLVTWASSKARVTLLWSQRCKQPTNQPTDQLCDCSASPDFHKDAFRRSISISISSRALKTRMCSGVRSQSWSWSRVEP